MIEREDEEKSRGFKVDDRRRFSAEGDAKPEQPEAPPPPPPQQAAVEEPVAGPAQRQGSTAEPPPEINFVTFVVSLSTQVLMHLGEIPDPMTNKRERDLAAAQHIIDILGMLQDKTRGNLDHEEESLLRSILFDLRMKYVESARHPG
jgi:hypothetical protein